MFLFWGTQMSIYAQKQFDQLNLQLDSILIEEEIPGCQVVIVDKDSILWAKNFGFRNVEEKLMVDQATQFRIASITKTFTTVAVMQLHDRKIWSIQDELFKINPEARIINRFKTPVRLIHLLEHTSGLDDNSLHKTWHL